MRIQRTFRFGLLLLAMAGLLTIPVGFGKSTVEPECKAAMAWVKAHGADLPTGFDQVVSFPVAYRHRIASEVSPEVRAALWEEHWKRYLAGHPELTIEQEKILEAWIALPSSLYDIPRDNVLWGIKVYRVIGPLIEGTERVFAPEQLNDLFMTLGPRQPTYLTFAAAKILIEDTLQSFVSSVYAEWCACIDCGNGPGCECGGCTAWACWGGFFTCDGDYYI